MVSNDKYEVTTVADGKEVLANIENIDLYLLQDSLAGVTGLEICQQLRHSEQKDKPTIIFSHQSKFEAEALEKGASAFLKVPCQSEDLLKLIEQWLEFATMGAPQKTKLTPAAEVEIDPSSDDEIQEINTTAEVEKQEAILPQETQATASRPPCILLVDDSRLIHASVGRIIDENGFKLIHAMDGVEGLEKAIEYIPDLIIADGHGLAHPRRFGIACHLGLILDKPAIGCAKSRLCGNYSEPSNRKGAFKYICDKGEIIGAVLRSRSNVNVVYVSVGHRVSLDTAIELTLSCCKQYKIPETTRYAHKAASGESVSMI